MRYPSSTACIMLLQFYINPNEDKCSSEQEEDAADCVFVQACSAGNATRPLNALKSFSRERA